MRREKKFNLKTAQGDLAVEVYEIRPKDLYNLYLEVKEQRTLPAMEYAEYISRCCNLTPQQLGEFYPNELRQIVDAFKEVNADFLAPWPTVRKAMAELGLGGWLIKTFKDSGMLKIFNENLSEDLKKIAADLRSTGISMSGITGGDITPDVVN